MRSKVHTPNNTIPRIDAIWAAVSVDETGEGVCGIKLGDTYCPLIAADEKRLEWVIEQAKAVAEATGKIIKLIKLTERTELLVIKRRW